MIPEMKPGTKYRIIGPIEINGMNVYRIWDPFQRKIVFETFSWDDCKARAKDLVEGRVSVFFRNIPFEKQTL